MYKKNILFIFITLIGSILIAQDQLKIEYELIEPEENFTDPSLPSGIEFKIPKRYFELILNKNESIWKTIERVDNEQKDTDMAAVISFPPSGDLYKNVNTKLVVKEEEAYSKSYLIKDSLSLMKWEITRESKHVLDIEVQKATYNNEDDGMELIAWYAPKLSFKNGPDEYWGLPGLILEIEIITHFDDNSKASETYTATKIEALKANKKIEQPTKGIVVTKKEFDKIIQENFERMRQMRNQGVDKD